jgi:hypothetical protein
MSEGFNPEALPGFTKDPANFFLKLTVLYGANNTGKSTMLLDIIYQLKQYIPLVYAFGGTPGSREALRGIVPDACIEDKFTLERAKEIWDRQTDARATYDKANDMETLRSLFRRVARSREREAENTVTDESQEMIERINESPDLSPGQKKDQTRSINNDTKDFLVRLYKNTINEHRGILAKMDLVEVEKIALKFLFFNPNVLVIVDDCGSMISKQMQEREEFKNYYQMYRHAGVTPIFTFQDDLELISKHRKQPSVSIFTTDQCASAFFERGSNSFSKPMKYQATRAIEKIFDANKRYYPQFTKLAWVRDDVHPFRAHRAEEHGDFQFGSAALWEYCRLRDSKKSTAVKKTSTFGVYKKAK